MLTLWHAQTNYTHRSFSDGLFHALPGTDGIREVGLTNGLIVLAQALLETGYFSSRVCKEYNNLFGLYDSKNREYFRFARWEDSVVAYQRMIQYKYKGGNYFQFLKRIGYAEDPRYLVKLAKVVKSIYKDVVTR